MPQMPLSSLSPGSPPKPPSTPKYGFDNNGLQTAHLALAPLQGGAPIGVDQVPELLQVDPLDVGVSAAFWVVSAGARVRPPPPDSRRDGAGRMKEGGDGESVEEKEANSDERHLAMKMLVDASRFRCCMFEHHSQAVDLQHPKGLTDANFTRQPQFGEYCSE